MDNATGKLFPQTLLLMEVERGLLHEFLSQFRNELGEYGLTLPDPLLSHEEYSRALSRMMMSSTGIPDVLFEALCDVVEMAYADGHERLQEAIISENSPVVFREDSSNLDFAIQAWLHHPGIFKKKRAEIRITRLSSFEYFQATAPAQPCARVLPPAPEVLDRLTHCIDPWYAQHKKGTGTTHIEAYMIADECWLVIRHGDGCVRMPAAGIPQRQVMHFRPERDDVAVYSPESNELRINVKTKGEAQLYREAIGFHLFGDVHYFSNATTYTLDPLRELREQVLDTAGVTGVREIMLTELHVQVSGAESPPRRFFATNLFSAAECGLTEDLFPDGYVICQATFDFYFGGEQRPRSVHVCPPNKLKLSRHCDARLVHRWLSLRGLKPMIGRPGRKGGAA